MSLKPPPRRAMLPCVPVKMLRAEVPPVSKLPVPVKMTV